MEKIARNYSNTFWHIIDVMSYNFEIIAKYYHKYIGIEYEKEMNYFKLSKYKKVLHIGMGAYPITAITLSKNNGMKISGVDRNPFSVELSKKIIKEKKLENKIKVINKEGENTILKKYDLIIVSGCSVPKIKVLNHVFKNADAGCKILVREGNNTTCDFLSFLKKNKIEIIDKYICKPKYTSGWVSYMLEKKLTNSHHP